MWITLSTSLMFLALVAVPGLGNYIPFDAGARLSWNEAKSLCESHGYSLPDLYSSLIDVILLKYPYLAQESFWSAGRCSWKNISGQEINVTGEKFPRITPSDSYDLCLECYGLPNRTHSASPCIITADYRYVAYYSACFMRGVCPQNSVDYGEICVPDKMSSYGSYCYNQQLNSEAILETVKRGVHLPVPVGRNSTKYWIRLGTYSCSPGVPRDSSWRSMPDYVVNRDCIYFSYDRTNLRYSVNASNCQQALARYVLCYYDQTTTNQPATSPSTARTGSSQTAGSSATTSANSSSFHPLQMTSAPMPESEKSFILMYTILGLFLLATTTIIIILLRMRATIVSNAYQKNPATDNNNAPAVVYNMVATGASNIEFKRLSETEVIYTNVQDCYPRGSSSSGNR